MKKLIAVILLSIASVFSSVAKTDKFGTWIEFELTKELFKNLELSFIPEVRLQDDFRVDEYMFDGKLSYEPIKYLSLAAAYRVNTNIKNKGNEVTKRYAFDITGKKGFGRFDASLRGRLTNYAEDEESAKKTDYFRPRIKLQYDIKGNKIRPFASYELFRDLENDEFSKSRFDLGFTRKFGKVHRIGVYYRLQDYFNDRNSINIVGIDYRIKL